MSEKRSSKTKAAPNTESPRKIPNKFASRLARTGYTLEHELADGTTSVVASVTPAEVRAHQRRLASLRNGTVIIDDDLRDLFPTSVEVNAALRSLASFLRNHATAQRPIALTEKKPSN